MVEENGNKSLTRRILAIMFGLAGVGILSYMSLQGSEMALGALVATVASVTSFYFGAKSAQM